MTCDGILVCVVLKLIRPKLASPGCLSSLCTAADMKQNDSQEGFEGTGMEHLAFYNCSMRFFTLGDSVGVFRWLRKVDFG